MLAWDCPTCSRTFAETNIGQHLEEYHVGSIGGAYVCGDCDYEAGKFDQIAAHCLKLKHDPENVERGDKYEAQNRRLLSALKNIQSKLKAPKHVTPSFSSHPAVAPSIFPTPPSLTHNPSIANQRMQIMQSSGVHQYHPPPIAQQPIGATPFTKVREPFRPARRQWKVSLESPSTENGDTESRTATEEPEEKQENRPRTGVIPKLETTTMHEIPEIDLSHQFGCMACGDSFYIQSSLMEHIRIKHSNKVKDGGQKEGVAVEKDKSKDNNNDERDVTPDHPQKPGLPGKRLSLKPPVVGRPKAIKREPTGDEENNGASMVLGGSAKNMNSSERFAGKPENTCQTCGKVFSSRHHVRRHEPIHTGNRPFACKECGKGFIQMINLQDHTVLYHTRVFPFSCRHCKKGFLRRLNCLRHENGKCSAAATSNSAPEKKKYAEEEEND